MARYKLENNTRIQFTAEEETEFDALQTTWDNASATRKLAEIKSLRLERLIETDYLALSDVTLSDSVKTWRQTLRDIPANHTDENAYDLLLARNDAGELTHSIWSKP